MFNKPSLLKAILSSGFRAPGGHGEFLARQPACVSVCGGHSSWQAGRPRLLLRTIWVSEQVGDYNRQMARKESEEIMDRPAQTHAHATAPLQNREPRERTSAAVIAHPCSLYVPPPPTPPPDPRLLSAGLLPADGQSNPNENLPDQDSSL